MLHLVVEAAFDELLACWRAHEHRRTSRSTTLEQLAASRVALDRARDRMHLFRVTLYPSDDEAQGVAQSVWCETLDAVVHLRWLDRHPTRPGYLVCPCAELVPIDWHGQAPAAPAPRRPQ